jgi:hypothetical protein
VPCDSRTTIISFPFAKNSRFGVFPFGTGASLRFFRRWNGIINEVYGQVVGDECDLLTADWRPRGEIMFSRLRHVALHLDERYRNWELFADAGIGQ